MSRVIVVGSGIAGLVAALEASQRHEVALITKSELTESNTKYAQGGIAVALSDDDSIASHIADTLVAGAGINNRRAVSVLCSDGPARVRELIALGVHFDEDNAGQLARGHEAAHSRRRVVHATGDGTGLAIETALVEKVRRSGVEIHEYSFLRDLIVRDGQVTGVTVLAANEITEHAADAVILATGGAGQLYRHTTNPEIATGDGVAAAFRAGVVLSDVEFFQFHPTSLAVPGNPLISEAVRGEGALLLSTSGTRFMQTVHEKAELAPRDIVARAIAEQMAEQNGVPILLDATALGSAFLAERFPGITAVTRAHGFHWDTQQIPVTPAAHYWMGGIRTDDVGRTSLPGLFAIGEAANTGAHGANRLASNSLLESLVFAHRAATAIDKPWINLVVPENPESTVPEPSNGVMSGSAVAPTATSFDRVELQRLMWSALGIVREGSSLAIAQKTLGSWTSDDATVSGFEDRNLLDLARVIVRAAISRQESRGAHYRRDFPTASPGFRRRLSFMQLERRPVNA